MKPSWKELIARKLKGLPIPQLAPLTVCCFCWCVVRRSEFMRHQHRCAQIEMERRSPYSKFIEGLAKVKDEDTQQRIVNVIQDSFVPFDLEALS